MLYRISIGKLKFKLSYLSDYNYHCIQYTAQKKDSNESSFYFNSMLLKLRTKIKTMNLENSIIDRLIICFRHIKQAFPLKLLAKPLKMLLKNCQFAHWMLI